MLTIGLTGGLASGKTTIANLFAQKGIAIIDTDIIARELVEPDKPAYQAIIAHFGDKILQDNKRIDRAKLRQLIFENSKQKDWLEQLLHPLIRDQVYIQINVKKSAYCIVVIPLLIENYPFPYINHILVVDAPKQLQIERAVKRDNISAELAKAILTEQASQLERLKYADDVICNDGDSKSLEEQVATLHEKYLSLSSKTI